MPTINCLGCNKWTKSSGGLGGYRLDNRIRGHHLAPAPAHDVTAAARATTHGPSKVCYVRFLSYFI